MCLNLRLAEQIKKDTHYMQNISDVKISDVLFSDTF